MPNVVIARWTAKPREEEAVAAALARLAEASRSEPGNLAYQPHRDPDDPRVFVIYEVYVDEDAITAHTESPHFQEHALGDAIPRLEKREREYLETWDPPRPA
jgi:quinol monooxygenase YgiN